MPRYMTALKVQGPGLFWGLAAWVVGTGVQLQQPALWSWQVYGCIAALALVLCVAAAIKNVASVAWVGCCVMALAFASVGLRSVLFASHALPPDLEGRDVRVTGVVADMPQRNESGLRFRLQVEAALLDGATVAVPPLVDVGWYAGVVQPAAVQAGERWAMTLRLKAPHGSRNPFGFDYELWLWEQGVQATAYVRSGAQDKAPELLGQTWLHPLAWARQGLRDRITTQVADRQAAGLIAALVVGDQHAIDQADWDVFRATGVAHLVSISGLHITMFAWGATWVVGWLWRRSGRLCLAWPAANAALCGGVALAVAYAAFSGWGVPAQRTCIMLGVVAVLRLRGVRWPWPVVWMLACAAVVLADPWALLQAGFWLSFVAVGVLFATDMGAPLPRPAHSNPWLGISTRWLGALREQWVITLALAPLTLLLFGQVSLIGLVANALAIPWVTLVVTPLAMVGSAVPWVWDVAVGAIALLMQWLQWLAAMPWATLSMAMPPVWLGVAGVVGGLLLVFPGPWALRVLGMPLLLPVLLWRAPLPAPGEFHLLGADIGQGNAVLVRTANHALLFDAGPRYSLESDAGHRVLLPLLQALHTQLDMLVLSHRDTDHVGGAAAVLAMQPQATLLSSIEPEHPLQALRSARRCEAGQAWEWDGVRFEVLHPKAGDYDSPAKPNAMSCVLRIASGAHAALLVGDIEQAQEARLVQEQANKLQADVLLVPHHGSKTSSSPAFLDAVAPQWAWVQAGYRNRFGHPAAQVTERYVQRGIRVVDSPHCGAMHWRSEWAQAVECTREKGRRYWHHDVP